MGRIQIEPAHSCNNCIHYMEGWGIFHYEPPTCEARGKTVGNYIDGFYTKHPKCRRFNRRGQCQLFKLKNKADVALENGWITPQEWLASCGKGDEGAGP